MLRVGDLSTVLSKSLVQDSYFCLVLIHPYGQAEKPSLASFLAHSEN